MTPRVGNRVTFTRWSPFAGPLAVTGTVETIDGDIAHVRIEQGVLVTKSLGELFEIFKSSGDP